MITLQQDADGFIPMNRHYPASVRVRIAFTDGSTGEFSGQTLNNAYDAALAEFRARNGLDARGFNRNPAGRTNSGNKVDFVPVHPGMGEWSPLDGHPMRTEGRPFSPTPVAR